MVNKRRILILVLTLALAGCGSDPEPPPPPPKLPLPVVQELATTSDAVAAALDADDHCAALDAATRLRDETKEAINTGRVPALYQDELSATVNDLVSRIECIPVEPDEEEEEDRGRDGKGKGNGKGKGKGKNGGDD
jgi:hypothetical protein